MKMVEQRFHRTVWAESEAFFVSFTFQKNEISDLSFFPLNMKGRNMTRFKASVREKIIEVLLKQSLEGFLQRASEKPIDPLWI